MPDTATYHYVCRFNDSLQIIILKHVRMKNWNIIQFGRLLPVIIAPTSINYNKMDT